MKFNQQAADAAWNRIIAEWIAQDRETKNGGFTVARNWNHDQGPPRR